ncbi:putative transferase [Helianthus annuus]|nr:putative transferase [Helianthus annuus]
MLYGISARRVNSFLYGDDKYDRIWFPSTPRSSTVVQTSNKVSSGPLEVPLKVMSTAIMPNISTDSISLTWNTTITNKFMIYIHFAEVEILSSNQTRELNIYLNEDHLYGPFSPSTNTVTLKSTSPFTGFSSYTIKINKTLSSTLPPVINALEIYRPKQFQLPQTEDQDGMCYIYTCWISKL